MGTYLNPGSGAFRKAVLAPIYVDKTAMISHLNSVACTSRGYVSVSRPRRFGKTMAADMLCAYYGRGTDARELFEGRRLAQTEPVKRAVGDDLPWNAYLGAFDVIRVTMTEFLEGAKDISDMLSLLTEKLASELLGDHDARSADNRLRLVDVMRDAYARSGVPFVVVIDEWDAPMRERKEDEDGLRLYLEFLREWLKDKEYIALAYMTGILPIKKYGAHSALNMFDEYSMAAPMQLAEYAGFTEAEVRALCDEWGRDFEPIRAWYDGYEVLGAVPPRQSEPPRYSLYAPLSVSTAVSTGLVRNYWGSTETYEALADYIRMDFDGLKETIALLMDGGRRRVNISRYQNDMTSFKDADDVLALLIHLGYLGWDDERGEAFVPNREVLGVFRDSTEDPDWEEPLREYEASKALVRATWAADEQKVAAALEAAHDRADNKTYGSEAALSYAVRLAYYAAQKWYTTVVELDSGKGYADVAYLPSPKHPDKPALLVELKWKKSADTALSQIRDRRYPDRLAHYEGNLLLVGVSYDADARPGSADYKRHTCRIERA